MENELEKLLKMLLTGDYSELETIKEAIKDFPKEEKKEEYRPYMCIEEFFNALIDTGGAIKRKNSFESPVSFIVKYDCHSCTFMNPTGNEFITISYNALLKDYVWQDNTPCGVKNVVTTKQDSQCNS